MGGGGVELVAAQERSSVPAVVASEGVVAMNLIFRERAGIDGSYERETERKKSEK